MTETLNKPWHSQSESEVVSALVTSEQQGLTSAECIRRQEKYGLNRITQKKGTHPVIVFLQQFNQPLIYILLASSLITGLLREWADSGVILGVVLVNAIIGFLQEIKAMRAIDALAKSMIGEATVVRNGKKQRLPLNQLTLGDIVLLQSGDRVPADLRLVHLRELQISESALTGESVPVEKKLGVLSADTVLADRSNMAYSSTFVTYGVGTGVVTAIGDATEVGRINQMISSADVLETPLTKKIGQFSQLLLYIILALAVLAFAVGLGRGGTVIEMFMAAVALAVGAIPEGLPAALTITLAIGVSRMAKRHAIIRKLPAVETLGSTSVICSDKTGTLTQNQMTVQNVFTAGREYAVTGVGYLPKGVFSLEGKPVAPETDPALKECLLSGLLCNDSNLVETPAGYKVEGDPTEGALISSAAKARLLRESFHNSLARLDVIPFESEYQYMATLHHDEQNKKHVIYMKGSIESVLVRCSDALDTTGKNEKTDHATIQAMADQWARRGLRVLAFARKVMSSDVGHITHDTLKTGMTFLGLQSMIDPPRPEVIQSIRVCQAAGIRVKMITGDHELTALAIAHTLGLVDSMDQSEQVKVINGKKLTQMSDQELLEAVRAVSVFARVAPEDKLRLVKAMQVHGEIIAMTGDGVNDAPALRQANIGIAMGITGTEVAKEAADMVLTDDNFATIQAAVEEGRGVYDNLIKFITWTLPTNLGEGLVILAAILAGVTLPILPLQILWINMTTAVLLGLMLAFEPIEPGNMNNPPRPANQPIITGYLMLQLIIVGLLLLAGSFGLFEWAIKSGRSLDVARTLAVNVFVLGELFYLFNCRSLKYSVFRIGLFSNVWIWVGVASMLLLQVLFTHAPFMNVIFHSAPLTLEDWVLCTGVGVVIFTIIEIVKMVNVRFKLFK